MLNNFDNDTLKAAHWLQIRGEREFGIIMKMFESELARLDKINREITDEVKMRQNQGACQVMADFIHQVKTSGEVIDIINERKYDEKEK